MNDSIVPTQSPSRPTLGRAYVGIGVALAVTAAVALIQWFAPQFAQVLDWQQTAIAIYFVGIGILGSLVVLPSILAGRSRIV